MIGHSHVFDALGDDLPPVALFLGPHSVGKWTAAEHLRREHQFEEPDVLRVNRLTVGNAREVARFSSIAPVGHRRLAIIRLDDATAPSQHVLLKSLEEAPPSFHAILIGTTPPLPTIVSRAHTFHFSLLTEEEVAKVLVGRRFSETKAQILAALSGGHVRGALAHSGGTDAKVLVLAAINAIRERDSTALDGLASRWQDEHTELLTTLCLEVITRRWRVFSNAETEGLGSRKALEILKALRPDVRPRLAVRSGLMSIVREAS